MKKVNHVFAIIFSIAILAACASGDSETLKQARQIQTDIMKNYSTLDSSLAAYTERMNESFTIMTADTTLMQDTLKLAEYMALKTKFNEADALKNEMSDWKGSIKMLPTADEIAKGAENPFGDKAKDQDILASIKKSQEEFAKLKTKVEGAIK